MQGRAVGPSVLRRVGVELHRVNVNVYASERSVISGLHIDGAVGLLRAGAVTLFVSTHSKQPAVEPYHSTQCPLVQYLLPDTEVWRYGCTFSLEFLKSVTFAPVPFPLVRQWRALVMCMLHCGAASCGYPNVRFV